MQTTILYLFNILLRARHFLDRILRKNIAASFILLARARGGKFDAITRLVVRGVSYPFVHCPAKWYVNPHFAQPVAERNIRKACIFRRIRTIDFYYPFMDRPGWRIWAETCRMQDLGCDSFLRHLIVTARRAPRKHPCDHRRISESSKHLLHKSHKV